MRSRDTDIVIVPGLGGSGPDHWQSRWQAKLPNAHRVEQDDWDHPRLDDWVERLADRVAGCSRPVVVVAHSLGVALVVHAAARGRTSVAGAFLVACPDDAAIRSIAAIDPAFAPLPRAALPWPSLLVGSRNDPYSAFNETGSLAQAWGAPLLDAGEAGHINPDSGHGPWPEGLMAFGGFLNKL